MSQRGSKQESRTARSAEERRRLHFELLEDRRLLAYDVTPGGELVAVPDANFDNNQVVDGADFLSWARNFNSAHHVEHAEGDANQDGQANSDDLASFQQQFGNTYTEVDLSITKTAGQTVLSTGAPVTYTITVTNNATTDVIGANVIDVLPDELTGASWTASITGSGNANLSGTGNIDELIDLTAGSSITYVLTATVVDLASLDQTSSVITTNAAHVSGPVGTVDIDPSDNSALDTDLIVVDPVGSTGVFYDSGIELTNINSGFDSVGYRFADVNGDGLRDIISNSILINNGMGGYDNLQQSGTVHTALGYPKALVDLDQDNDLDIVAVHAKLINDGSGVFTFEFLLDIEQLQELGQIEQIQAADLDGDLDVDLVVVARDKLRVLWNNGSGGFVLQQESYAVSRTGALFLGDMDHDGDMDAVVEQELFVNDGSGAFTPQSINVHYERDSQREVVDIDGDGHLDIIDFEFNHGSFRAWKNSGAGNFIEIHQPEELDIIESSGFSLGDLDDDGDLDAIVALSHYVSYDPTVIGGSTFQEVEVPFKVFLNDGTGVFQKSDFNVGTESYSHLSALEDFDGDGDLDVLVTHIEGGMYGYVDRIYYNADFDLVVDVTSSAASVTEGDSISYTVTVTNDGPADIEGAVVSDMIPSELTDLSWTAVINGSGAGNLSGTGSLNETVDLTSGSSIVYTVTGDIVSSLTPNQGTERIISFVASVEYSGTLLESDLTNNKAAASTTVVLAATGGTAQFVDRGESYSNIYDRFEAVGDFDGDGDLDAVVRTIPGVSSPGYQTIVLFNDGVGNFGNPVEVYGFSHTVAVGDMNNDGYLDLVLERGVVLANDGTGQFSQISGSTVSITGGDVELADLNGDGYLDAVFSEYVLAQPIAYSFNDGTGRLLFSQSPDEFRGQPSLGDIDGDGDVDLLMNNPAGSSVLIQIHKNNGQGSFETSTAPFDGRETAAAGLSDVDNDGDLDVFITRLTHHEVWLNDGAGNFTDTAQVLVAPGQATNDYFQNLHFADLDGDNDLDVIVAPSGEPFSGQGGLFYYSSINNQIWLNDGQGNFTFDDFFSSGIVWRFNSLFGSGDLDGDGDLDLFDKRVSADYEQSPLVDHGPLILFNGGPIPDSADFNFDSEINGADFLSFYRGFGTPNPAATKADGDADNDFDVDADDFAILMQTFGTAIEEPELATSLEPAATSSTELTDAALAWTLASEAEALEEPFVGPLQDSESLPQDVALVTLLPPRAEVAETASLLVESDEEAIEAELADELLDRLFG